MRNYTVYKHTTPSGKVYVGITGMDVLRRWDNGRGYRKQVFRFAIDKYGWENITHEILEEGLTLEEANERERFYIALYDSSNPVHGYNVDLGGDNLGSFSESHKEKLRQSNSPTKQALSKRVLCVETGRIFLSIREAARETGANRRCISWCCDNVPRHKTTSGYHWKFV